MILEAKNILYSYKSKRDKNVLNNVSATLKNLHLCRLLIPVVQENLHFYHAFG